MSGKRSAVQVEEPKEEETRRTRRRAVATRRHARPRLAGEPKHREHTKMRVIRKPDKEEGARDIRQRLNAALDEILAKGRQSSMTKPGGIPRLIERERAAHGRTQVSNVDLRGLEGYLTPEGIRRAEQIGEAMEYA